MRFTLTFLIFLSPALASAAEKPALQSPDDALLIAAADAKTIPFPDRLFIRYVWIKESFNLKPTVLVLNLVSRDVDLFQCDVLGNGTVIRVDLRKLSRNEKDLVEYLDLWEELAFDPSFNILLTKGVLKGAEELPDIVLEASPKTGRLRVPCRVGAAGFDSRWVDVVAIPTGHVVATRMLQQLTGSFAPVVDYRYLQSRFLSSIKGDDPTYAAIFGGMYYDLNGFRKSKDPKKTDEDLVFEGVGILKKAKDFFEDLRSDQRGVQLSDVTVSGRRRWDMFPTASVQPGKAQSFAAITHDIKYTSIDIENDTLADLLDFKDDAREMLFVGANGLMRGVLFNGKGELQEAAPSNIVRDNTVPAPFHQDLQAFISCLRCHMADGSNGWKSLRNDVPDLVKFGALPIFQRNRADQFDAQKRINGLYKGSPDDAIANGRRDQAKAFLRCVGPLRNGGDQTNIVRDLAKSVEGTYADYWYRHVGAAEALADLGITGGLNEYREMVPLDVDAKFGTIYLEDHRVGMLRAGKKLTRADWALVQGFLQVRVKKAAPR